MIINNLSKIFNKQIRQGILINRLMKVYSILIILFFGIGALSLSTYSIISDYRTVQKEMDKRLEESVRILQSQNYVTLRVLEQLVGRSDDFSNLTDYMTMSQSAYFNKVINDWQMDRKTVAIPNQMQRLFDLYPEMQSIIINLDDNNHYLEATKARKTGQFKSGKLDFLRGNYMVQAIRHPDNGEVEGSLYLTFKQPSVSKAERNSLISTFAFDDFGRELYDMTPSNQSDLSSLFGNAIKRQRDIYSLNQAKDYRISGSVVGSWLTLVTVKKTTLIINAIETVLIYSIVAAFLAWCLLKLLFGLFRNYIQQVSEITDTLDLVSAGDLSLKIDNSHMELELFNISEGINLMLDNINQSIEEIYTLEVEQRDAQMSALQAQINPHFLYNTLEYVRMYALSCRQEELADVIYAFAALLRNNISKDKVTSLKEELDFCEKYIYLYQMRYPESFAYHVVVDPSLSSIQIPKFVIQPLVENYFVHGIDYNRRDNALSIKAKDSGNFIKILIEDNGKGVSDNDIRRIEDNLRKNGKSDKTSIGLENVYLRLMTYFKDDLIWSIGHSKAGGFKIEITFRKEV
ncbi:sensor histidine kinase [Streptococcus hongkongensis]|nr:ATPase [Streptococcus uberis]